MKKNIPVDLLPDVERLIVTVRDQRVILDADLALLYGVPTRVLNQAVKRNLGRFPHDFMFRAKAEEIQRMRSQTVIASDRRQAGTISKRNVRHLPYAFTEHGAIMAANVLNSSRAAQMSVFVVRAFVKMRGMLTDTRDLARKLAALEQELKGRLDVQEAAIVEFLQRIMKVLDPPPPPPEPPPPEIGFHVKEDAVLYRAKRKNRSGISRKASTTPGSHGES